jgi:hypothetical protein
MKGWRTAKQGSTAPIREPIPSAIADRLSIFGGELWAAALADSLAAELDKAQADLATQTEHLAACFAKEQQQQAAIDQANAAAIENRHRAELAEAARDEVKNRADQLTGLLKDEQAAHAATKAQQQATIEQAKAEEKAANEKAAELVGRLKLYEELAIKKTPAQKKPKNVEQ